MFQDKIASVSITIIDKRKLDTIFIYTDLLYTQQGICRVRVPVSQSALTHFKIPTVDHFEHCLGGGDGGCLKSEGIVRWCME